MSRFIKGESRSQITLFPEAVNEYIEEDNPVRVIDVFVDGLDLSTPGFKTVPADTGRPAYHPGVMLKLFIYGYLNRVQSSRRLERKAGRNAELMWLLGREDQQAQAGSRTTQRDRTGTAADSRWADIAD